MGHLIKYGILLLLLGIGAFFYKDSGNVLPISNNLDTYILFSGGGLIAIYILVLLFGILTGKTFKISRSSKCVKCGQKIGPGQIYCEFHQEKMTSDYLSNMNGD